MKINAFLRSILALAFLTAGGHLNADEFVVSHRHSDYDYFIKLLDAALKAADGEHTLKIHSPSQFVPQNRALRSLSDQTTPGNIQFTGHSVEREQTFAQVDVPLTKGLFGYRVLLVREEDQEKLRSIRTLEELKRTVHMGSATSWPDTLILEHAGFQVIKGTYNNLWRMLLRKRFDAFPRSIYEARPELERHSDMSDSVFPVIDTSLLLHYKFDLFFYVAKNDTRRASIVRQGLERLIESGEFDRIFYGDTLIQGALNEVKASNRHAIELENPFLSDRIKNLPAKYWHSFN